MLVTPPNSPLPSVGGSRSSDVRPATQESARGLAETLLNCGEGAGELVHVCARGGRRPGGTPICVQACSPLPVRLLVNRSSIRRSSGYTYGPHLRLPAHCQACQRSLTRKRPPVQIQ